MTETITILRNKSETISIQRVSRKKVEDAKVVRGLKGVSNKFFIELLLEEVNTKGNDQ